MKIKNNLAIVVFVFAFAIVASAKAQTSQERQGNQNEPFKIFAEDSEKVPLFSNGDEMGLIYENIKLELNEKAAKACFGRHFSIDTSNIKYATRYNPAPGGHMVTVTATARAVCIN